MLAPTLGRGVSCGCQELWDEGHSKSGFSPLTLSRTQVWGRDTGQWPLLP